MSGETPQNEWAMTIALLIVCITVMVLCGLVTTVAVKG